MLATCFHPLSGHDPNFVLEIDLVPPRANYPCGSSGGQDAELQRPRRNSVLASKGLHEVGEFVIG
jgi:hypothetical protein